MREIPAPAFKENAMKKILISISVILCALSSFAGGGSTISYVVENNAIGVTNVLTTKSFSASVYSLYFDVEAGSSNLITVASPTETLLTITATADVTERPRIQVDNTTGSTVTTVYEEFVLVGEPLTITMIEGGVGTNDVKVVIKTDDK